MAIQLNLQHRDEPKVLVAVRLYPSVRDELAAIAQQEGVSSQQIAVTLINNYLDSVRNQPK